MGAIKWAIISLAQCPVTCFTCGFHKNRPLCNQSGLVYTTTPAVGQPYGAGRTSSQQSDMCRAPQPHDIVVDATSEPVKEEPLPYVRTTHNRHFGVTEDQQGLLSLVGLLAAGFGTSRFDAPGTTVRLRDMAILYLQSYIVRSCYNLYLEWAYATYPERRIQKDSKPSQYRDVTQRTEDELALIEWHDRLTGISTFCLLVGCYVFFGAVLYPTVTLPANHAHHPRLYWLLRVVAHHYCLSFGMYWAHRYLHVNKFLWRHVHSLHHFAKTPLARTTYMDHWFDNFFNAFISEVCAPIIVPLPFSVLVASRLFRVCESLEKHSGLAGGLNIVHTAQRLLPFAQMPHHHDWHHEGHCGANYTFASLGGLWDVLFNSRHHGRSNGYAQVAATRDDTYRIARKLEPSFRAKGLGWDHPLVTPQPLLAFFLLTFHRATH